MRRRFLVPEVIQTSLMDCGPAALKALFGGFQIYLSYGRLRELSHTDVDGTSIDVLEELALALGMRAEQRVLPPDLLLLDCFESVPAIVVLRLPDGGAHFVVLWRVHGSLVQIMDPAIGRRWVSRARFFESLYVHEQSVERGEAEAWANSAAFTAALEQRLARLGVRAQSWPDRAHQDAALRLAGTLQAEGQLSGAAEAQRLLDLCALHPEQIPERFWALRADPAAPERVVLRGAVLVSVGGPAPAASDALPAAWAAVRNEPPPPVWSVLAAALRESGGASFAAIALAIVCLALGTVIEAGLFRWLLDPGRSLQGGAQRLGAGLALLVFLASLLGLRWPAKYGLLRLGTHLELRLRARFLVKIPRLADRYFQSRLVSEMAFRAHWVQLLRQLPDLAGELLRAVLSLVVTALAIVWLYPGSGPLVLLAAGVACLVPLCFQPLLLERDLRLRELSTALGRFYLDALLASRPVQAHAAESCLRTAYSAQLEQWAASGLQQQSCQAGAEVLAWGLALPPILALVYRHGAATESPSGLLLLAYWAIAIPTLGSQIAGVAAGLPLLRNTLLRLLEPLSAPDAGLDAHAVPAGERLCSGVQRGARIEMEGVSVVSGGHLLLEDVNLRVESGEHVAIVGASGAGKSSLVGLLLGWHAPATGTLRVDGDVLDARRLLQLRRETAWIDPQVQLFRRSLFDNLRYGNEADPSRWGGALAMAQLGTLLQRLPSGLQTELGEGGALVSGGEGQRVRIARALARTGARLAILDEPTRGLDRESRELCLQRVRQHFADATLFHITHHISDTSSFDRVLVIDQGRIIEQGSPARLRDTLASRYRELLEAETQVRASWWSSSAWRRLRLRAGSLEEVGPDERHHH